MDLFISDHTAPDSGSVSTMAGGAPVTVVAVAGEIDVYTAPILRDHLDQLIDAGSYRLVVDLGAVTFMDSTALGVLVGRLKLVRGHGGSLVLACNHDRVLKVFTITGLDKVFAILPTAQAAIEASRGAVRDPVD